jgi:DNA-binding phage protein
MKTESNDDAMAELYRADPEFARQVLNTILEDEHHSPGELLVVLRHMTKAFGGMTAVATQAQLNPTQLYRTLSPKGNPGIGSLSAILRTMGLKLAVQRV